MEINYPKITIVTPVFNQVQFLEKTIQSVIGQKYPNLEYVIIDGGSTDGTLNILEKYSDKITKWVSEPDSGMYHALNKGFDFSTGEIMGWVNSDDILLADALYNVARLFNDLPKVNWIQGLNSFIDLNGKLIEVCIPRKFSFIKFLNHDFKWIQQESTFWRRSLWEKAGGKINTDFKLAGDFELWFRFFQHEKLYNATLPVGAWRNREGQLSGIQMDKYLQEVHSIINAYDLSKEEQEVLRSIKHYNTLVGILLKVKILKASFFINKRNALYNLNKIDIKYSYIEKRFIVV
ncbi:glycosyltransferase family 2 protein [Flavivirga rizhaonensis]|uniref:Glycosyltransferase n=1 Tax=Flavivirga rizhaonensis TaxID=2559571 RepID=A0A4S1E240_9FLAO|nr:glycosyltransferase family 2 protein [Flavivirga rizhaonensis]TGV04413.1 glycosyltransferase [Flavivirga rizhaonensis]